MSIYFYNFAIISPLRTAWPFVWTNLNPLYQGIICARFAWNWPSGSLEDEYVKSLQTDGQTDEQTDRQMSDNMRSELVFLLSESVRGCLHRVWEQKVHLCNLKTGQSSVSSWHPLFWRIVPKYFSAGKLLIALNLFSNWNKVLNRYQSDQSIVLSSDNYVTVWSFFFFSINSEIIIK